MQSFKKHIEEGRVTPGDLKAQSEGKKAARKGQKYEENPYEKGSSRHLQWSKGHNAARAAGMREEVEQIDENTFKGNGKTAKVYKSGNYHLVDVKSSKLDTTDWGPNDRGYKSKEHAIAAAKRHVGMKEEVEQIDELSQDTLKSYNKKAGEQAARLGDAYAKARKRKDDKHGSFEPDSKRMAKIGAKAMKRDDGAYAAQQKIRKEDVEQMDEISKDLAGRYKAAATRDKEIAGRNTERMVDRGDYDKAGKQIDRQNKRLAGIKKANKVLNKEEVELTEAKERYYAKDAKEMKLKGLALELASKIIKADGSINSYGVERIRKADNVTLRKANAWFDRVSKTKFTGQDFAHLMDMLPESVELDEANWANPLVQARLKKEREDARKKSGEDKMSYSKRLNKKMYGAHMGGLKKGWDESVDENLNFMIPKGKAASDYMSRKVKMRQDQHKEQDPKHAKTHARNMVDMDKAAAKAKKKGVAMRDYGKDNWKVRNGVKRGKLPEEFNLSEEQQYDLVEAYLLENNIDVDSLTEEQLNEIIGKVVGGAFKAAAKTAVGAARLAGKAAKRMSTAGRADAAEKKAAAQEKKNKDRERIKAAQDRLRAAREAARNK